VALAHRLVTQFTSFVAVEERVVNEGGRQRTMEVPVEMPQGVRYEGVFGTDGAAVAEARAAAPAALYAKAARFAGRVAAQEAPMASATDAVRSDAAAPLDARVRAKLTARLARLLEAAGDPASGWVRVAVTVSDARAETIRVLEGLGLRVAGTAGRVVTGVIAREGVARLATEPAVVTIDLAVIAGPR
jgi:hypothetical protein